MLLGAPSPHADQLQGHKVRHDQPWLLVAAVDLMSLVSSQGILRRLWGPHSLSLHSCVGAILFEALHPASARR